MMIVYWQTIAQPDACVAAICASECADIPADLLCGAWFADSLRITDIQVDEVIVARHDADLQHIARRDAFVALIQRGHPIPSLIVLRCARGERYLIDGYARFRALRAMGVA